jgi:hypothetical protein
LVIGGDSGPTRMVAYVATELGDEVGGGRAAPDWHWRGATREEVLDDTGKVFIDPTVTNPVFGGHPADYMPWFTSGSRGWLR